MSEANNTESGWDTAPEEKPAVQAGKPSGFVSNSDKNDHGGKNGEARGERSHDGDRPPRGGRGDRFEERQSRDRFDDRPPRGDRFDDRPPRGGDRFDDRPPRGGDRFDDRPPRGGDRFDDRPPRGGDRFDDRRGGDRYDDRRGRDRYDDRRDYDRYDDHRRGGRDEYRDYDRYDDRRGYDTGKRGYSDADYSRRDRDGWDSRRGEPYREKRQRTRQDEAAPNETLGVFALSYDLMQRDFDNYLATKLEKLKDGYTAKLIVDRMTGKCKGYGFVTFNSVEDATEAKNLLADGDITGQNYRVAFSIGERRPTGFQRRTEAEADAPKNDEQRGD